jgi:hypothetical protein
MRIRFKSDSFRRLFFEKLKESYSLSWKEIYTNFNIPKSTFDMYKSGVSCIPEELFTSFINRLGISLKEFSLSQVEKLSDNHGQIKGGKKAYTINFNKFEEGRRKGIVVNQNKTIKKFNFNIPLSLNICEVIGAFIGDGFFNCYKNKLYQVEFSGDNKLDLKYYEEKIIPFIQEIIPTLRPHIYFPKDKNAIRIVFYSKEFFCFLKDFLGFIPGKKSHSVFIPNKIIANKDFIYPTVRGIFDTDGCVFLDKRKKYKKIYPRITFQTVSKPLFEQLNHILSEKFNLYTRFNERRQIYIIEIYGINQVKYWMKIIGFSNQRHLDKIKMLQ